MGCRTGFYLVLAGDYESKDIVDLMKEMFDFMRNFEGEVPGACAKDCGNYLDMNLNMAKYLCNKYYTEVLEDITDEHLFIHKVNLFSTNFVNETNQIHFFHPFMSHRTKGVEFFC